MSKRTVKFLFWSMTLVALMACVPTFATPFPTADPNAINTFIVETANAAASQTAAALPTSTATATTTPTPRNTETPSPTFTSTVIFILSSPTKPATATPVVIGGGGSGGSGGGSSTAEYSCQVMSVSPANGTTFNDRDNFDATWQVKNNGTRGWDRNSTDFYYLSGSKIHKVAGYDLNRDVDPGQTINLAADMQAPKDRGTYTTTWTLRIGSKTFCNVSLTINVR